MDLPQLFTALFFYIALLFVISVHEWAHAWTANLCGDPTARYLGRMTWNPIAHIDMIGTVLIPLFFIFAPVMGMSVPFAIIGWGKPVPVNPNNYNNYVRDDVLVSAAGPLSNLVITIVVLVLIKFLILFPSDLIKIIVENILLPMAQLSFFLAFFNLIPIPPLDGSHILRPLVGYKGRKILDSLGAYGFIILIIFINTPLFDIVANFVINIYFFIASIIL